MSLALSELFLVLHVALAVLALATCCPEPGCPMALALITFLALQAASTYLLYTSYHHSSDPNK